MEKLLAQVWAIQAFCAHVYSEWNRQFPGNGVAVNNGDQNRPNFFFGRADVGMFVCCSGGMTPSWLWTPLGEFALTSLMAHTGAEPPKRIGAAIGAALGYDPTDAPRIKEGEFELRGTLPLGHLLLHELGTFGPIFPVLRVPVGKGEVEHTPMATLSRIVLAPGGISPANTGPVRAFAALVRKAPRPRHSTYKFQPVDFGPTA